MCGIAGVIHRDGRPVDRDALRRMAAALTHRGPDGEGYFVEGGAPSVGLANRRLAVVDLPGGAQPMSTPEGDHTLVYNGELYNASEVRSDLEARGHRFRTRSDTEVVLRSYVEWGPDALGRLNGMWAFAVWDRPHRRLFAARDRLGVKPLIYAQVGESLWFSSEIKGLLASDAVPRDPDLSVLPYYLSQFVAPEPRTFFRGIERLPAGHYLVADAAGLRRVRYWDCNLEEEEDRGASRYREEIGDLLEDSVRRRMAADVPVGIFLSGGIDSGLLATLAARRSSGPLRTFSIGFEGDPSDERAQARRLAETIRAHHEEEVVTAREAAASLPALLEARDEPSQSLLQEHFVARLARRSVTVALSGIGGDELFSSYPTHRALHLLSFLDGLPPPIRSAVRTAARILPSPRLEHLAELLGLTPEERVARRLIHQTPPALGLKLLTPELRRTLDFGAVPGTFAQIYARSPARDPLNRLNYVLLKTYLADELLRAQDLMSMRHSLETRTPFLDYRLVEKAMRIPARHKMNLRGGKILLRSLFQSVAPDRRRPSRKQGFAPPLHAWVRTELSETLRDVLSEAAILRRGVFDPSEVRPLLESALRGHPQSIQVVMMLYSFEVWGRRLLDTPPSAPLPSPVPAVGTTPLLSVVVVNWNTRPLLSACLRSVETYLSRIPHEVLVVDNASSDDSAGMVERDFPTVRLLRNEENVGFAKANNQAMRIARGSWFLLLNSDTYLQDSSVQQLLEQVRSAPPALGVAHCRLLQGDGRLLHSTYRFPSTLLALVEDFGLFKLIPRRLRSRLLLSGYWDEAEERDVDWVSGAFMLLRREVFEKTGGFSEDYFMYGEDMEWCYRIRDRGWSIRHFPQASIVHLDHSSSAIRWGDQRVVICIDRLLDIYRRRNGKLRGLLFHAVKIGGSLFRWAGFTLASWTRRRSDYLRAQRRYYALALRTFVTLAWRGSP